MPMIRPISAGTRIRASFRPMPTGVRPPETRPLPAPPRNGEGVALSTPSPFAGRAGEGSGFGRSAVCHNGDGHVVRAAVPECSLDEPVAGLFDAHGGADDMSDLGLTQGAGKAVRTEEDHVT